LTCQCLQSSEDRILIVTYSKLSVVKVRANPVLVSACGKNSSWAAVRDPVISALLYKAVQI